MTTRNEAHSEALNEAYVRAYVQAGLRGSRWTALLKVKHAKQTLILDAPTRSNLSPFALENISRAQAYLNLAQAALEGEGV